MNKTSTQKKSSEINTWGAEEGNPNDLNDFPFEPSQRIIDNILNYSKSLISQGKKVPSLKTVAN